MPKKENEDKKIRCEKCGSTQNYIKQREKVRFCRRCGHKEPLKKEDKK